MSECTDWTPWRKALRVNSNGGGFIVDYIFYICYSVCSLLLSAIENMANLKVDSVCGLRQLSGQTICHLCET